PDKAAAHALQWGVPILESAITLIDGNRLYYRGHDAVALARTRSVEEVAALIWTGRFDAARPSEPAPVSAAAVPADARPFVSRAQSMLAAASAGDALAFDLRPEAAVRSGWRILALLTHAATRSPAAFPTVDRALARAWGLGAGGPDVLRAALILCADHE